MAGISNREKHHRQLSELLIRGINSHNLRDMETEGLVELATNLAKKPGGHNGSDPLIAKVLKEIEMRDLEHCDFQIILAAFASLMSKDVTDKSDKDKTIAELERPETVTWARRPKAAR